jgi:electron transfer flavoprotein alpha subunit
MKTLLIGESRQGRVLASSYETIAFADVIGAEAAMFIVAPGADPPAFDGTLYLADPARYGEYDPPAHTRLILDAIERSSAQMVVFANSSYGIDTAPRVAAALGCAQVSDAVGYAHGVFTVSACNSKLRREVRPLSATVVVTIQRGAFPAGPAPAGQPQVETIDVGDIDSRYESLGFSEDKGPIDLAQAEVIVAAGRGIGKQHNIALVDDLAAALGGQTGASRPVVDAGWTERFRQVGVSGVSVAPRLYVACGISGAVQHLAGVKGAEFVVAVNTDREAPIAEEADVMVIADLEEFLPILTRKLKAAK